jgi:hypothetical protein
MLIAPAVFRQINDTTLDIQSSDYNSCGKHFKKLARLLHSPELQPISGSLTEVLRLIGLPSRKGNLALLYS